LLACLRGLALAAMARNDESEVALRAARDGATSQGLPTLRWPAQIALGTLLTRQGLRAAGRQELQEAARLVEELARQAPARAAQQFRERARASFPGQVRIDDPDTLTARERDVAAQVALGRTNREIADALYLSERTVETHVRNILGKLEFTSRAQIAVWVVEQRQQTPDQ
jgi:DNA-binding CsgD family transcriptional regulator